MSENRRIQFRHYVVPVLCTPWKKRIIQSTKWKDIIYGWRSFFDEMKESLVSAGKDVSQKAKEVSGVAKLKLDVKSKEDYVEKQYAELGRTYFDAHKDDEENAENEQFKVIKEALAEIERMKTEILNLQGAAECPNCGARMPQGASFCSSCGAKMAEPEHFTGEVVDDEKFDE